MPVPVKDIDVRLQCLDREVTAVQDYTNHIEELVGRHV